MFGRKVVKEYLRVWGWTALAVLSVILVGFLASCGSKAESQPAGVSTSPTVFKTASSWDVQLVDAGEGGDDVGTHTSLDFDPADGYPAIVLS